MGKKFKTRRGRDKEIPDVLQYLAAAIGQQRGGNGRIDFRERIVFTKETLRIYTYKLVK